MLLFTEIVTKIMQTSAMRIYSQIAECSLSYAKIMQTSGKKACFQFPECSLSYAKIMQGERNSKAEKQSFFRLDIAEPKLILCKGKIFFRYTRIKTVKL